MCNCGKKQTGGVGATLPAQAAQAPGLPPLFEYVGVTALTVFGPASGRRYRFEQPGATLTVDPRDHAALQSVPHLRMRPGAPAWGLLRNGP